jgi:predicted metal-dependent enzyme (double-stranded beta helix superfamily)
MIETKHTATTRFIEGVRKLYRDESDPDQRWEKMRPLLAEYLADPELLERSKTWPYCHGVDSRAENLLLYEDPECGFVINGLVKPPGHPRYQVHDHAHIYTLYGVLDGHQTIDRYERLDDGSRPDYAEIKLSDSMWVGPGVIDLVRPWEIHVEKNADERTVAVIVRSEKPGEFLQGRYDPETFKYSQGVGPVQTPVDGLP